MPANDSEGEIVMSSKVPPVEGQVLLRGLAMGESPRWHESRLWLSDWGAQEILAVDLGRNRETVLSTPFGLPFCIDWLPDKRTLFIVATEWRGMDKISEVARARTGLVLTVNAPAPAAGWP
jgi:sugar lactone lactonase YvrE